MILIPKISVIVPVYNVEQYLPKCIDSILAQTFTDFELLLIDDGSPDNSGKICDEYAKKDKRIRVFHKENGGVSSARNVGINAAVGDWLSFVDSDDAVNEKYLKDLISGIIDNCYKGLIIQGINYCNKNRKIHKSIYFNKVVLYQDNILDAFSKYKIQKYGYPFSKLYNRNVLIDSNVKFDEQVNCNEDTLFLLTYFLHIEYVSFIYGSNYYYINTNLNSNSKKKYSYNDEYYLYIEYNKCVQNIIFKYKNHVKENDYNIIGLYEVRANLLMRLIRSLYNTNIRKKERLKKLKSLSRIYYNDIINYKPNRCAYIISKFLLVHKMFYLFDCYNKSIINILYKIRNKYIENKYFTY